MVWGRQMYNLLFQRTSAFVLTEIVSAVFLQQVFLQAVNALFDQLYHGKLWKHIRHSHEKKDE
ncbi:cytochrome b-c1 complex subunit 9-like [Protopterus annectens]|uniref:cytochrome b-c1 complex subunit 9-like n=1 Tax=Protopterus annectens TaxID=7888 RepID=UPI001CF954E1|nr:cytochrome b-c1 complex subunit 9-like [Protopterus annectens]